MTIGELKQQLSTCPDGDEIIFGCKALVFHRLKRRGDHLIQMEFEQSIDRSESGVWHVTDTAQDIP